jgi:hypothetical protein
MEEYLEFIVIHEIIIIGAAINLCSKDWISARTLLPKFSYR